MSDFQNLSENELQTVIENAKKALDAKQAGKRKEVIAQMKELAASINVTIEIHENDKKSARKGVKVAYKFAHPDDPTKQWTGRGVAPKWMQDLVSSGRNKSEFEI
jgi:DNA-binding protein H-NS